MAHTLDINPVAITNYCQAHSEAETDALKALNHQTYLKVLMPHMLSGHLQGRMLSMFSHMMRPKKVLEIGTFTGYATICLAEGLAEDGHLYTIDVNEELADMAKDFWHQSGLDTKITLLTGPALDIIPTLGADFDIVFIDADKHNYINYYNMVVPLIRPGGYILVDNVLWKGKVTNPEDAIKDKDLKNMLDVNKYINEDTRTANVLLPLRDGIMAARVL